MYETVCVQSDWNNKQLPLKSAIFHAMSWKYGFNIIRGCVVWIWNQIYDISIEMSQNHDGLKMASAIFYKPPIAANELNHIIGRIDFLPFFDFLIAILRHLQLRYPKSDFIFEYPVLELC